MLVFYVFIKCHTNCGAQMIYGPDPSTRGESKGPSRGRLWPKLDKIAFGYCRGQFSPRQTPKFPPRKKGKNGTGLKLGRKI